MSRSTVTKSMLERLEADVMTSKDKMVQGAKEGKILPNEMFRATVATKESQLAKERVSQPGQFMAALEDMRKMCLYQVLLPASVAGGS